MNITQNHQDIQANIERALTHFYCVDHVDELPDYVEYQAPEIIAVSKKQSDERVEAALQAGLRHFGENQVQEAEGRWADKRTQYPDLTLHMIGALQSNKAAQAVALFDVIHSVDREKIAKALKSEMDKQGRQLPCYVQVNIGEEEQKSGILPQDLGAFLKYCREDLGLIIEGLMCLPPKDEPAGIYFSLLKKYAKQYNVEKLSMGMSADYEQAAIMGSDYLRIGTALLGER